VPIAQELSPENLRYGDIAAYLSGISGQLQNYYGAVLGLKDVLLSLGLTLVDLALKLTVMLVIAFLLLVADDEFSGWFRAKFPRLMRERNRVLPRYVKAVDGDFEAIFFGNMLSVILFAFIAAAVYSVLNVFAPHPAFLIPYPLLLGVLCGLFAFLPVLGPWMIDVPILLYVAARSIMAGAFDDYAWYLAAMALAIFIFVENLPGYLLRPIVSHGNVNVVLLMLAYIVGPVIFGFPGLFIGAIVLVLVTHYFNIVLPELSEDLVEKQGRAGVSRRHRRTSGR
jgi:predicted PurR-regulated permease PerM